MRYVVSEDNELSRKLADHLECRLIVPEVRIFSDGEQKITLPKLRKNSKIVVIQYAYPETNSRIMRSLMIISRLKEITDDITLAIPYMPYARQDKEFLKGEIITSKAISKLYNRFELKILTVDIHSKLVLKFFKNIEDISAVNVIGDYCSKIRLNNPVVVSPDMFWKKQASILARYIHADSFALNKFRDRKTGKLKILSSKTLPIKGRDIILCDDMISTGKSMILAAKFCKKNKSGKIIAICTHGLFIKDAKKKIKESGISKIIYTNTSNEKDYSIDISKTIAERLV